MPKGGALRSPHNAKGAVVATTVENDGVPSLRSSGRLLQWGLPLTAAIVVGMAFHYFATWALYMPPNGTGRWIVHLLFTSSVALNGALLVVVARRPGA